ncbi:hypothetical protein K432DRAFT_381050 [Lepidopterella palustris CBS 459.81]|uniref:Uncharacterized protein n=1 Tax=Lepidopterella palustris CBS 459.81 TaxID=1314670 RepID=A0A8E2JGR3_9PEZI|nr:hypothetical protein K432DRAFT_381050 [Lepidopterella palustris CBS 459.81]
MTTKTPLAKTTSNRLPAPSLFVGPPSLNTSTTSLLTTTNPPGAPSTRAPLVRQRSALDPKRAEAPDSAPSTAGPFKRRQQQQQQQQQQQVEQQSNERTDAIWAEMQNTLEEVELSAVKGTHVSGAQHEKALDELRVAQIELAKAWARSEAEEEGQGEEKASAEIQDTALGATNMLAADRSEKLAGAGVGGSEKAASERTLLEEETEKDIELSRRRREANDRYFQRVNAGVLEVVRKLEEVARAMKGVEQESKEIWRDGESIDTASIT